MNGICSSPILMLRGVNGPRRRLPWDIEEISAAGEILSYLKFDEVVNFAQASKQCNSQLVRFVQDSEACRHHQRVLFQ